MVAHRIAVMGADEVRAIRRRTGLSRARFAERFGLDPRAVQDWEQGRRRRTGRRGCCCSRSTGTRRRSRTPGGLIEAEKMSKEQYCSRVMASIYEAAAKQCK